MNNPLTTIITYLKREYRQFYIQLFSIHCSKCDYVFLYTYHTFDLIACPNCGNDFCKYCMEEYDTHNHDKVKCNLRYLLLYFFGLIAFMLLYLKFIFMSKSHSVTKYAMVTVFLCEYIMFYNEVDSFISNCISVKNIILCSLLVAGYDERDVLFYILVGIIQMICIVLINNITDKCRKEKQKRKRLIR
jgi:hypothetical protein